MEYERQTDFQVEILPSSFRSRLSGTSDDYFANELPYSLEELNWEESLVFVKNILSKSNLFAPANVEI